MRKLVVSQFVTVDGVAQDPGGGEVFDRGGWAFKFNRGEDGDKFKEDELMASDALLLGRITYEGFAAAWPSRSGDMFSDKFNAMAKYVASTTLKDPEWTNTHVLQGDVVEAIEKIKAEDGGDILVNGSMTLVRTLVDNNLVDEYRLMVFPIVLGAGKRAFEGNDTLSLKLVDTKPVGPDGVIVLTYAP
jgi:dihydrofolate reductase